MNKNSNNKLLNLYKDQGYFNLYKDQGYFLIKQFFKKKEISLISNQLKNYHKMTKYVNGQAKFLELIVNNKKNMKIIRKKGASKPASEEKIKVKPGTRYK